MKGICYTGLCFSDSHQKFIFSQHLERSIWHAMSDDSNPLYEPRLVVSLVDDDGGGGGGRQVLPGASKRKAKAKAKGKPANKRPRSMEDEPADPIEDEPAADDDDDALSGDANA